MNLSHLYRAGSACALATSLCLIGCGGGGGGGGGGGAFFTGAPDPSFGGDGYAFTDLPGTEFVTGVAVQPDNKIVVVGTLVSPTGTDMFVARFNANATLDLGFGGGTGFKLIDFGGTDEAFAVALRASDGGIFVAGRTDALGGTGAVAVAQLTTTGDLDATFGVGGLLFIELTTFPDEATAVIVQPDENVLVAGTVGVSSTSNFFVTRLTPSGNFDNTWQGNLAGFPNVRTLTWNSKEECHAMALDPITGNVVVAGSTDFTGPVADLDFAVARLLPTGLPDTTFNGTGQTTLDFSGKDDVARGVQIDLVGRVLVSGITQELGAGLMNAVVARFTVTGALDTSFNTVAVPTTENGNGRFAYTPVPAGTSQGATASLLQPDGRHVVVGFTNMGGYDPYNFLVSRLETNGTLDTSFANGAGVEGLSFSGTDSAAAVARDSLGRLVVAGVSSSLTTHQILVMRLMP